LISAYRETAKLALSNSKIVTRTITADVEIYFEYPQMSQVMRFIEEQHFKIKKQEMTTSCTITIAVPESRQQEVADTLNTMYPITSKPVD
jgi:putative IMPACT (imprinted ancient) family translation regulator